MRASEPKQDTLSQQFVEPIYAPFSIEIHTAPSSCSCVTYAKEVLGRSKEVWGNAWEIKPTTQVPFVGAVIITTEGRGHVGVVVSVDTTSVTFTESNYKPCAISQRTLLLEDPRIRGYF